MRLASDSYTNGPHVHSNASIAKEDEGTSAAHKPDSNMYMHKILTMHHEHPHVQINTSITPTSALCQAHALTTQGKRTHSATQLGDSVDSKGIDVNF